MSTSTTGGEWTAKASALKSKKLGNACPGPSYNGETIDWARISTTTRPVMAKTGGTGQSAKGITR